MNLVVFASGSGSNFQSIINATENGTLDAAIRGLITDKPDIGAIKRAHTHDIPSEVIDPSSFKNESAFSEKLLKQLRDWDTDLIVLAGYLKKIPLEVIQAYENKILNIHPSLLPKYGGKGFYGMNVHKAVLEAGETKSGCSVHIVTEEFDKGPVIAQVEVPVEAHDSPEVLASRILKEEHQLYPTAIQQHIHNLQTKSD